MLYMDLAALRLQTPGLQWEYTYREAAFHLRFFLRAFPTNPVGHLRLAQCHEQLAELEKAAWALEVAILFQPSLENLMRLGRTYERGARRQEAIRIYAKAAEKYPHVPTVLLSLARLHHEMGDEETARRFSSLAARRSQ